MIELRGAETVMLGRKFPAYVHPSFNKKGENKMKDNTDTQTIDLELYILQQKRQELGDALHKQDMEFMDTCEQIKELCDRTGLRDKEI